MRTGIGVLTIRYLGPSDHEDIGWKEPAVYIGNFRHGRLNGCGLLIGKSGAAYAGSFKDNLTQSRLMQKECHGDVSARGSDVTRIGRRAAGIYVGQFKDGEPSDRGVVMMSGAGYVGTLSDDAVKPRAHKSARKGRRPGVVTGG